MAARTEYEMLWKLGAQLGKDFNGTFSSAQKILSETQKEIQQLNEQQADISAYEKAQQSVEKTSQKLDLYKTQLENVRQEMSSNETFSSSLANKEATLEAKIRDTEEALAAKNAKLQQMESELTESGIDMTNLAGESERLKGEINELKEAEEQAGAEAAAFGKQGTSALESIGSALAATGIVAGLKKIAEGYIDAVKGAAEYADTINTVSIQYGIATEDLQAYYYAAELVDVSVDTLTGSMSKQIKSMSSAANGTKEMQEAYDKLGVEVQNVDGSLRDADTVYWEVIDGLHNMTNETERDAIAQKLLGKSAMELNTLIKAGSGVMSAYKQEAQDAGYVLSDKMLASLTAMDDEFQRSKANTEALKNTLGAAFAPEITNLTKIWNGFISGLTKFTQNSPVVVKSLMAIAAEAAVMFAIYKTFTTVKKLHNTLSTITAALTAKEAAAATTAAVATTAQAAATESATAAQTGLNAAMLLNPYTLLFAGIAALTVGLIAFSDANKESQEAQEELTASSQAQKDHLEELNEEYERAKDLYGENSNEARALKGEYEALSREFESSKETLAEFDEKVANDAKEMEEANKLYREHMETISAEESSLLSLAVRLENLQNKTNKSNAEIREMETIVGMLNESIPGLNLNLNTTTGAIDTSTDAIKRMIEAQAAQKRLEETSSNAMENLIKQQEATENLEQAKQNLLQAEKELADYENSDQWKNWGNYQVGDERGNYTRNQVAAAKAEHDRLTQNIELRKESIATIEKKKKAAEDQYNNDIKLMADYTEELNRATNESEALAKSQEEARKQTEAYNEAVYAVQMGYLDAEQAARAYGQSVDDMKAAAEEAAAYQESLNDAINAVSDGFYSAEEAARVYGVSANAITTYQGIDDIITQINTLKESYDKAKEAAEKSIQGQYQLWDQAATVAPTSIGEINTGLETQIAYWSDYNKDIGNLLGRTDKIKGLSKVIASFADGSTESVNAIAGMAAASDEDLQKMVDSWNKVKEEQEATTKSLVDLTTDYLDEMNKLEGALRRQVESFDMSTEAEKAAKSTLDGYLRALRNGEADIESEANKLRNVISRALATPQDAVQQSLSTIHSTLNSWKTTSTMYPDSIFNQGYASGTENAEAGIKLVGENGPELMMLRGGERILNAAKTQDLLSSMETQQREAEVESARTSIVISVSPSISVNSEGGTDIRERIQEAADGIVELVMETLEEAGVDAKRGVYA